MPTFEYTGETPQSRPTWGVNGNGNPIELAPTPVSDPVDYVMAGSGGAEVKGRQFEKGEHVEAASNPDPARFTEV